MESNKALDREEAEQVVQEICSSFDISLNPKEFHDVSNVGELIDRLSLKIKKKTVNNCTYQQAFYKLRELAVKSGLNDIRPSYKIGRYSKKVIILLLRIKLAFPKTQVWSMNLSLSLLSGLIGIFGVIYMFTSLSHGLVIVSLSILFYLIAVFLGKPKLNTWREMVVEIVTYNYSKSRRNPSEFNQEEFKEIANHLFVDYFDIKGNLSEYGFSN